MSNETRSVPLLRVFVSSPGDRWLYAVPVLGLLHVLLLVVLHSRPGVPAVVLWHIGPIALTAAAVLLMVFGLVRSVRARLTWTATRAAGFAGLVAISTMPLAYQTYPSSRDDRPSHVRFRLPLDGPVTVIWGGPTRDVNYHVFAPPERWAYDLLVTHEGRSYRGEGTEVTDYYAYGLPVLAPAAGTVRVLSDGAPDSPIGSQGVWRNACGNHVVIDVAPGEFLFLCHLQPRSIAVSAGEQVVAGQPLGRVGNSGRSTQPHVHVHLQTSVHPELGEGIPLYFHDYRHERRVVERGMPTGGSQPQIVEHVGSADQDHFVTSAAGRRPTGHARRGTQPVVSRRMCGSRLSTPPLPACLQLLQRSRPVSLQQA